MTTLKSVALGLASALVFAMPAYADNTGLAVTGSLAFGPNGSNGGQYWVPPDAVIGSGVEYSYTDGANQDTADFTATELHINDSVFSDANGWEMTFSTPGGFAGLSLLSSTFVPGLTYGLDAGKIVLDWAGTTTGPHSFDAVFCVSPVPEPETYGMLLAGLGLLGFTARRKAARGA